MLVFSPPVFYLSFYIHSPGFTDQRHKKNGSFFLKDCIGSFLRNITGLGSLFNGLAMFDGLAIMKAWRTKQSPEIVNCILIQTQVNGRH